MVLTVLEGDREVTLDAQGLQLTAQQLLDATGWELKAQGLCRGDACVPVGLAEPVSLADVAAALGRPLAVAHTTTGIVAALGEPAGTTAGTGEVAAELSLTGLDGAQVPVTRQGTKTAVVAWSSWCGCRYELPAWKALAEELRDGGLTILTVALDEPDSARTWVPDGLTTAFDPDHRLSDVLGVVQVPSTVWLDEQGRVVKPATIAPGDDQFRDWTQIDAAQHHEALRRWVHEGQVPSYPPGQRDDDGELRTARTERRLAAWLHRNGHVELAEEHFAAAVGLAPLDFSIVRASMPLRGKDPFGTEFFALWQEWEAAGRPGYQPT